MKVPEGLQKEILRTLYKAYPKPLQVKELSQSMPGRTRVSHKYSVLACTSRIKVVLHAPTMAGE